MRPPWLIRSREVGSLMQKRPVRNSSEHTGVRLFTLLKISPQQHNLLSGACAAPSLTEQPIYAVGNDPRSIAVADFDGDGTGGFKFAAGDEGRGTTGVARASGLGRDDI